MTQHLFVYGTLAPGQPNEKVLTQIGGKWKRAYIKGTLKSQGWGSILGYPAIVLEENGEKIDGFIFSSENLQNHWDKLDDFEGKEYSRMLTQVLTDAGDQICAYIYVLRDN